MLANQFGGHEINDENLSQWKHGGYHEWEMLQAALAETQRIVSEGMELDKVGDKALADKLAAWLLGRYAVATRQLIENENDPAAWKLLREVCHDLVALRRGDQPGRFAAMTFVLETIAHAFLNSFDFCLRLNRELEYLEAARRSSYSCF